MALVGTSSLVNDFAIELRPEFNACLFVRYVVCHPYGASFLEKMGIDGSITFTEL